MSSPNSSITCTLASSLHFSWTPLSWWKNEGKLCRTCFYPFSFCEESSETMLVKMLCKLQRLRPVLQKRYQGR